MHAIPEFHAPQPDVADPKASDGMRAALGEIARLQRQAFLQRGWARAAVRQARERLDTAAVTLRGDRYAIAVSTVPGDEWAAQYQRLAFRSARADHALGQYGTRSRATWGAGGFVRESDETLAAENRATLARLRRTAQAAKGRAQHTCAPRLAIAEGLGRADQALSA